MEKQYKFTLKRRGLNCLIQIESDNSLDATKKFNRLIKIIKKEKIKIHEV